MGLKLAHGRMTCRGNLVSGLARLDNPLAWFHADTKAKIRDDM